VPKGVALLRLTGAEGAALTCKLSPKIYGIKRIVKLLLENAFKSVINFLTIFFETYSCCTLYKWFLFGDFSAVEKMSIQGQGSTLR